MKSRLFALFTFFSAPLLAQDGGTALRNLVALIYQPQGWETIPEDLGVFKPLSAGAVTSGVIDTAQAGKSIFHGIMWMGGFLAPEKGTYKFLLDADDGARLSINGKAIAEIKGYGAMDGSRRIIAEIDLEEGSNPIKIEYFQGGAEQGIILGWKGPKSETWQWLSREKVASDENTKQPQSSQQPANLK